MELDQRAPLSLGKTDARQTETHGEAEEHDETHAAHGPGESDLGEELLHHEREDETSRARARQYNPQRQGAPFDKVGGHEGVGRAEQETVADAAADALGEKHLPVALTERDHEDAQRLEGEATNQAVPVVACVHQTTGKAANEAEQKDLDGHDPGDLRVAHMHRLLVVGLEESKRVDESPGTEQDQMRHQDLRPGLQTSIWRRGGGVSDGRLAKKTKEKKSGCISGLVRRGWRRRRDRDLFLFVSGLHRRLH